MSVPSASSAPGDEDDRAPVAPVRDVAADEHQAQRRDGLDEAQQAQRERLAGDLVGLERDHRGDRRHAQRGQAARGEQRPELGQPEQRGRGIGMAGSGHQPSVAAVEMGAFGSAASSPPLATWRLRASGR